MVWKESLKTYKEMLSAEGWESKKEVEIPIIQKITFKVSDGLAAFCSFFSFHLVCAFDYREMWFWFRLQLVLTPQGSGR